MAHDDDCCIGVCKRKQHATQYSLGNKNTDKKIHMFPLKDIQQKGDQMAAFLWMLCLVNRARR